MPKHTAAIFDMDGTLLDSMNFWQQLAPEFLKRNKLAVPEYLPEKLAAVNLHEAIDILIKIFGMKTTHGKIYAEFITMLDDYYRNHAVLKNGARKFLQKLHAHNISAMVFSSTPEDLIKSALLHCNIAEYFSHGILSADTVKLSKSHPESFLTAAERFNVPIQEIIVFEDAWYAANAAKQAGFTIIAVKDDSEAQSKAMHLLADFYIEKSYDEFPFEKIF